MTHPVQPLRAPEVGRLGIELAAAEAAAGERVHAAVVVEGVHRVPRAVAQ